MTSIFPLREGSHSLGALGKHLAPSFVRNSRDVHLPPKGGEPLARSVGEAPGSEFREELVMTLVGGGEDARPLHQRQLDGVEADGTVPSDDEDVGVGERRVPLPPLVERVARREVGAGHAQCRDAVGVLRDPDDAVVRKRDDLAFPPEGTTAATLSPTFQGDFTAALYPMEWMVPT
eukprot:CAMPEP_0172574046 /NCGR_PEP_ID=MMETSP1067-20121228/136502_2 /TAXON_ID=265564 ORGANISM="Thalassiosira punctigera, Strain Tpunct2005C2" /NCGR_SAMPLE_ID=MMETSP1067 /ASSEMBLY_ACC=CAM_ASM_000444 /LENGTH=175 /DNA_ID=CAMNT_0013366667 /DNA_START=685 /DNA_END=1209 /DNA_ORIENTATION=-